MNLTAAVISYLRGDGRVTALADQRVWGPPDADSEARDEMSTWASTPRESVLVMAAGLGASQGDGSDVPEIGNRIDVRCYGKTSYMADVLHGAVFRAMKDLRRFRRDDVLLQTALVSGGPLPGRDVDADWPYTQGVYMVNAVYE